MGNVVDVVDDIESIITTRLEGQLTLYTLIKEVNIIRVFSDKTA